ncbi:hypothetical protein ID866_8858 [Astraeus odoratus]|nr:hypothetical protein ID866_8858 [Astraeus odoratus]
MPFSKLTALCFVIAAAFLPFSVSFQPGTDYGLYKTTNLYNCSGYFSTSNVTVPNSVDTLPQLSANTTTGWERWDFFVYGSLPIVMRWSQDTESEHDSAPLGKIEMVISVINGKHIQTSVSGPLSYQNQEFKEISIGSNTFQWDNAGQWYNVTVCAEGYTLVLSIYSAMLDTFHPNVGYYNGRLSSVGAPDWFGSIPIPRGHSFGYLLTPDNQNITVGGTAVLKHTFSEQSLSQYLIKYSSAVAWGYSGSFLDTLLYYQTNETSGAGHVPAYLGRAISVPGSEDVWQSASAIYAVTDDTALYQLTTDSVQGIIGDTLGQFFDLGGGMTTYYLLNGMTLGPFNGSAVNGTVVGLFEVYQSP